VFFWDFFYIRSNIFSWFFIFFSSDYYSHGFYFIWHLERKFLVGFLTNIRKPKVILGGENNCSKNFINSGKMFLCLEFSNANQTRRTRFWFIWYLFWLQYFFVGHKGYFLTNSRFEKEGTIFNCKGFHISSIFRII